MILSLADGNFTRTLETLATVCHGQALGQDACLENSHVFCAEKRLCFVLDALQMLANIQRNFRSYLMA